MFGALFGWRKASKCKRLVTLLHCRLKLLKSNKGVIVKLLRKDIAQLLSNGQCERAFTLAEQLFKDQSLLDAYDLLGNYCEFIIIRFRCIRRYKECPEDINEAISTLIFATAWCGDLPELQVIRKLFGERYGSKFISVAAELRSGNHVNLEIREKFCTNSIPDDAKLKLIIEIAKEYIFSPWQIGCSNTSSVHLLQVCGNNYHNLQGFIFKEAACVTVSYNSTSAYAKHSRSTLSLASQPAKHIQPERNLESCGSNKLSAASFEEMEDPKRTAIFCLEEVKELQFNNAMHDLHCSEDKRIFLFNSCNHPESCNETEKVVANAANASVIAYQDQQSKGSARSPSYSHVHPKLPDYDELVAKFRELKKQHLQKRHSYRQQALYFLQNDRFYC